MPHDGVSRLRGGARASLLLLLAWVAALAPALAGAAAFAALGAGGVHVICSGSAAAGDPAGDAAATHAGACCCPGLPGPPLAPAPEAASVPLRREAVAVAAPAAARSVFTPFRRGPSLPRGPPLRRTRPSAAAVAGGLSSGN